jgi:U1 small nuclear ribonucleoprotein
MKAAYKDADGLKIMGRRIVVDVERGRTVKGWKPKRLGKDTTTMYCTLATLLL